MAGDGRGQHGNQPRGPEHPKWNPDGRRTTTDGYVEVRVGRTHPMADVNGWCYEHDLVAVSAVLRPLAVDEVVHHLNEVRSDNRWCNLEIVTRGDHNRHHNAERGRDSSGRFLPRSTAP